MTILDNRVVSEPTLFYTDDGVFFYADPDEEWQVGDIMLRVLTPRATALYQIPLIAIKRDLPFSMRQIEISMIISSIEDYGIENQLGAMRIL